MLSILISSHNRLPLFRRTLAGIARNPPSCPFEVIVADDGSTDDIVGELRKYAFSWTFIPVDMGVFTARTGIAKFWNCPALTNNVAFRFSRGEYVAQMGNEIIPVDGAFDRLLADLPSAPHSWAVSTTYDVPPELLARIDEYGAQIDGEFVSACSYWLLSNHNCVPNYLSVFTRATWEAVGGYDERYLGGIGAEDADFMRRVFRLPGFVSARSSAVSLHQYHGGVNHFYRPLPEVISEERLAQGAAINRAIYVENVQSTGNAQSWPWGEIGVVHEGVVRSGH